MSTNIHNEAATDERLSHLQEWLSKIPDVSIRPDSIRPASSDASFRRYFRIDSGEGSYIAMDAPPAKEDVRPFLHVAQVFGEAGVSVPKVIAQNIESGFLLLTDLGSITYLNQLDDDTAHQLYLDAIDALVKIQMHSQPEVLPEYDRDLLLRELMLFPEWFIGKHLNVTLTDRQADDLKRMFDLILANNLAQPQVFVHRDYHSRNLMVIGEGNPGILDFQDAVYGPITYDLVSLLRDAYIVWDEERVLDWTIRYWELAKKTGLPINPDIDTFYRDFEFMGLQRHLKVLGIFARLFHRDGKEAYLKDMPLVMEYARKTARRYSELKPLERLLDELEGKNPEIGYTF